MKKNLLTILALMLLFSNCTKKDNSSIHLKLTSPINSSSQNPSGINFTWESDVIDSSKIVIAKDPNFIYIVSEFTTIENKYLPEITFQPNKTYYWKVTKADETVSSSFIIRNVLNNLGSNKQLANFHVYSWSMNGPITNESYFIDTITIMNELSREQIRVIYTPDSIDRSMHFADGMNLIDEVMYRTAIYNSEGCSLSYNYLLNKVKIVNRVGGLGAGKIWEINF